MRWFGSPASTPLHYQLSFCKPREKTQWLHVNTQIIFSSGQLLFLAKRLWIWAGIWFFLHIVYFCKFHLYLFAVDTIYVFGVSCNATKKNPSILKWRRVHLESRVGFWFRLSCLFRIFERRALITFHIPGLVSASRFPFVPSETARKMRIE